MSANIPSFDIVGVTSNGIQKVEGQANQFEIPFRLSAAPPVEWIQIFQEDWRSWKAQASADFAISSIRIIGVLFGVSVDYDILSSNLKERFDFSKLLEGLRATVQATNDVYRKLKERENEQIFALKAMVEKLEI